MRPDYRDFIKAVDSLEIALSMPKNDIVRDASIQRFEYCVELAWKSARRVMGTSASAPKQVVREMYRAGLIEDVELWLVAIDQRNMTSHTYNEALAEKVYGFAREFLPHAEALKKTLEAET